MTTIWKTYSISRHLRITIFIINIYYITIVLNINVNIVIIK